MNDKKKKPIQVDTEFQSLTLPLGAEEMAELEENIFDHGFIGSSEIVSCRIKASGGLSL